MSKWKLPRMLRPKLPLKHQRKLSKVLRRNNESQSRDPHSSRFPTTRRMSWLLPRRKLTLISRLSAKKQRAVTPLVAQFKESRNRASLHADLFQNREL